MLKLPEDTIVEKVGGKIPWWNKVRPVPFPAPPQYNSSRTKGRLLKYAYYESVQYSEAAHLKCVARKEVFCQNKVID